MLEGVEFVLTLIEKIGERQLEKENLFIEEISSYIKRNISSELVVSHEFEVYIPFIHKSILKVGSTLLPSKGTSFNSGEIEGKYDIISSLLSVDDIDIPNINFNPYSKCISQASFYWSPSVAVSRLDLPFLLEGRRVYASVEVEKKQHHSINLLVGNLESPRKLLFVHYDSISRGVIDNGISVGLVLQFLNEHSKELDRILIVFSGSEELSYEWPVYWGKGFREFQKRFIHLFASAEKIVVVDSVGHTAPYISRDRNTIWEGFPINDLDRYLKKIYFLHGGLEELMSFYHCEEDNKEKVVAKHVQETYKVLLNVLLEFGSPR